MGGRPPGQKSQNRSCNVLLCSLQYYQIGSIDHYTVSTAPEDDALQGQQRKFQKELNGGIVSLVLLSIMAGAEEPLYGYQIAKQLEHESTGTTIMKQGTLYPVLRSLCAAGLLDSK